jgi:competence protein ComEA
MSRPTALVLASVVLAVLVIAGNRLADTGASKAPEVVAPLEPVAAGAGEGSGSSRSDRQALVVHVVGAVRRPGLLRLREGARVADALARAGGASPSADLAAVNLAAPLVDGLQIFVPVRTSAASGGGTAGGPLGADAEPGADAAAAPASASFGRKLSLGTATAEELDELPGVGPVTAQNILF